MKFDILTLDDFNVQGKTVLLRVDINQPVDKSSGILQDITRIKGCVPTIRELSDKGAKVVLLAHQGGDLEYQNYFTTQPHAKVISELLEREVDFIDDVCGPAARQRIKELKPGQILLLDNVRFIAEEMTQFETKLNLSPQEQSQTEVVRKLAPLADLYVCDAFAAAHRSQPSLVGFQQVLPSAMGRLFEEEYCVLSSVMAEPKRPCLFILGGAKIQDAFMMMSTVLENEVADYVLTGGLVSQIMLLADSVNLGEQSTGFIYKKNLASFIDEAKELLRLYSDKIVLPTDVSYVAGGRQEVAVAELPIDDMIVDIGQQAINKYVDLIKQSGTVFLNGPMGVFEKEESQLGTKAVWEAVAKANAYSVLGGGDSITAVNKYGLQGKYSYICTGGGAMVRFLTGEELPVVKALREAAKRFNATNK
ncbi:phosphoglycerate kinase [Dethiobacter alkaliphilus]|uniref:phosphoglycerate kinase n=1 Tax=Dethiobacter alkaliphilus TaxID=427926 RepID=UPI00222758C0|nr:phosphoglycerate kinase [Dethiobacter alkaliphilus]MCW3490008.1 phosphoglycerate kinase [Dethiobacter alkaliphilus]